MTALRFRRLIVESYFFHFKFDGRLWLGVSGVGLLLGCDRCCDHGGGGAAADDRRRCFGSLVLG